MRASSISTPRRALLGALCGLFGFTAVTTPARASNTVAQQSDPAPSIEAPIDDTIAAAVFVPISPCRAIDTREGARLDAASITSVSLADCTPDFGDQPVAAAAVTLTAVGPSANGHVTAFPAGATKPLASNLNYVAWDVRANSTVVQVVDHTIDVWTSASTDLLVDITGVFVVDDDASASAGRFVALEPTRLLDSRESSGRTDINTTIDLDLPGVPDGAVAAAVTVTTTGTIARGYFTVWGTGERPSTSTLNYRPGQTRASTLFTPIGEAGDIQVFTRTGEYVIVDLLGYFTGPDAPEASDGLFVPVQPTRLIDTRPIEQVHGGYPLEIDAEVDGVEKDNVAALVGNLTVVNAESRTWATVRAAGVPNSTPDDDSVSSVNYDGTSNAAPNKVVTRVSERGLQVFTPNSADVVVDVTGYFTGSPLVPLEDATPSRPDWVPRDVTIISDSGFAGVRWNGASAALQGAEYTSMLESCRRLVYPSCRGREGYAPPTVLEEIPLLPLARERDLLVVSTGYNDWEARFSDDFDLVMEAARDKGFRQVAWMNFRTDNNTYQLSGRLQSNYEEMNAILRQKVASGDYPDVLIWDRDAYTENAPLNWFSTDGVHQHPRGSFGMADWVSRHVAALDERPCPQPSEPGGIAEAPCPAPNERPLTHPDVDGLYRS